MSKRKNWEGATPSGQSNGVTLEGRMKLRGDPFSFVLPVATECDKQGVESAVRNLCDALPYLGVITESKLSV